jgi:tRNA uridine 5-carboxymethylaminomethyl modification enzyme
VLRKFDLIVVGGGHAGVEAAHSAALMGVNTLLLTNSIDGIATMPCNPAIGGPAKSQLVKEIDALGGLMGLAADATYLQMKTLNSSKGPAVQALRAQSDKHAYSAWVRQYLEKIPNLTIYQSSAKALMFDKPNSNQHQAKIKGVQTQLDEQILADVVVLTAGTFLEARIFSGDKFDSAGRAGEKPSLGLSPLLRDLGLRTGRLKTGTPPRIDSRSIDFSVLEIAPGDPKLSWFSFLPNRPVRTQYPCFITRTNELTHQIILDNLQKSPMYSGLVEASGPRYCPSIEDKVVRFKQNPSHHFFLEPEGLSSNEFYLQGCSTSLPIEVQWQLVRTLPGLSKAVITRPAYAVEYDYFQGIQFNHSLESKFIEGLFVAGQVLGTSGYEEAAAQGIIAGINSALKIKHQAPLILDRSSSYIGTLVDDLVTKEITDPYRMLTSRSEYRLLLRQDNADQRLTPIGREVGLVDDYRWKAFEYRQERIKKEIDFSREVQIDIKKANIENKAGDKLILAELIKRPTTITSDLDLSQIVSLTPREKNQLLEKNIYIEKFEFPFEVDTEIKYEGYILRQMDQIQSLDKLEKMKVPQGFDFKNCDYISLEARDKLSKIAPKTLGQASRVGGVTPNDISVLSMLFTKVKTKSENQEILV